MKIAKITLLASLATLILAFVTAAQAATYRIGVEGVIVGRNDIPGLPSPVIGPIGTSFSMFWYIDDGVVPTIVVGRYVYWQGLVNSIGFSTPTSSGTFSDYVGGNNNVFVEVNQSISSSSYYSLEGSSASDSSDYRYFSSLILRGPASMSLDDVGQLDPRPLSQWVPPGSDGNYINFATCPTISGGCTSTIGTVSSISFELVPDESDPVVLLEQLETTVTGAGPGKSFANKIMLAQTYLGSLDEESACLILGDFLNQVRAQRGKKLTEEQADAFTADATAIIAAIGCD